MSEPWHDECRLLRKEGMTQPEIAARLKLSKEAVRLALNETLEQRIAIRRSRERVSDRIRKAAVRSAPPPVRREPPGAITPEIKHAAILAFSKHEIDRLELMRRITPRDKWSGAGLLRVE